MEFTFDVSQTPLIGRRILLKSDDTQANSPLVTTGNINNSTLANNGGISTNLTANCSLINSVGGVSNVINNNVEQSTTINASNNQNRHSTTSLTATTTAANLYSNNINNNSNNSNSSILNNVPYVYMISNYNNKPITSIGNVILHSNAANAINSNGMYGNQQQQIQSIYNTSNVGTPNSPRRSASLSPADTAPLSSWKRPWMCQSRVRECLVNLLTTCGQRVGLPKSPSVSKTILVILVTFNL